MSFIFTSILGCRPFAVAWNPTGDGHCLQESTVAYAITGINIFTDIIVLVLPLPWLWKLQMDTSRKISITAMFLLGSL